MDSIIDNKKFLFKWNFININKQNTCKKFIENIFLLKNVDRGSFIMILDILLLIVGFILLVRGADYFVDGSVTLAHRLRIPTIIIGLTIVAMGTSAPEAAISILSTIKNSDSIVIGNIIGSNIANILLILGVTLLISDLSVPKNTMLYEIPFVGFITLLLCFIGLHYGVISRLSAIILLGLFVAFLAYLYITSKSEISSDVGIKEISKWKIVLYLVGGLTLLILGSNLTVDSAIKLAHSFGVSERIIGITVVAFGTSVPELVTCIVSAVKKQADIAVGNIIGSNIFNILFVLGITGVISPILFKQEFLFDSVFAMVAIIMLMLFGYKNMKLNRIAGVCLLGTYAIYLILLFA